MQNRAFFATNFKRTIILWFKIEDKKTTLVNKQSNNILLQKTLHKTQIYHSII